MIIRQIVQSDLPEIFSWFENRKYPQPIVQDIAPNFGIIAEDNGVSVACMWAYLTGRSIAFIEWVATNPKVSHPREYTDALIAHMKTMCEHSDPPIRALCFFTQNEKLAEQFKKSDFNVSKGFHKLTWTTKSLLK